MGRAFWIRDLGVEDFVYASVGIGVSRLGIDVLVGFTIWHVLTWGRKVDLGVAVCRFEMEMSIRGLIFLFW